MSKKKGKDREKLGPPSSAEYKEPAPKPKTTKASRDQGDSSPETQE